MNSALLLATSHGPNILLVVGFLVAVFVVVVVIGTFLTGVLVKMTGKETLWLAMPVISFVLFVAALYLGLLFD